MAAKRHKTRKKRFIGFVLFDLCFLRLFAAENPCSSVVNEIPLSPACRAEASARPPKSGEGWKRRLVTRHSPRGLLN
jgi:hypothetical protein